MQMVAPRCDVHQTRTLIDVLVQYVEVHPDRLTPPFHGAPPLDMAFSEVGLMDLELSRVRALELGLQPCRSVPSNASLPSAGAGFRNSRSCRVPGRTTPYQRSFGTFADELMTSATCSCVSFA